MSGGLRLESRESLIFGCVSELTLSLDQKTTKPKLIFDAARTRIRTSSLSISAEEQKFSACSSSARRLPVSNDTCKKGRCMLRAYPWFISGVAVLTAITFGWIAAPQADAQLIILDEQFSGNAVDTTVFTFSGSGDESFFGRTQLNSPQLPGPFDAPTVADGVLQLELNSYNPFAPGSFFLADEIRTIQRFAPTRDSGFSFETRARFVDDAINPLSPGIIGGAFLFGVDTTSSPLVRDEIDFELLSNFPQDTILTNVFNDDGFSSAGNAQFANVSGLDLTEFNDFRIDTRLGSTQFFVNDQLIRRDTTDLAVDPQDFRLNINAQGPAFSAAFSSLIQPTSDPSQNETFIFEVDSLVVAEIDAGELPPPPPPRPIVYQGTLLNDEVLEGSISTQSTTASLEFAEFYRLFGLEGEEVTITVERTESDLDSAFLLIEGQFEDLAEFDGFFDFNDPRLLAFANDELPPATGFGPFGDPSTTITLPLEGTGAYTVVVVNLGSGPNDGGDGRFNFNIRSSGNLVTVPEPSSVIMLTASSLILLRRRRCVNG